MGDEKRGTAVLVVAGVSILQDGHGLYNLNTLHKASGSRESKKPSNWVRLRGTKELIAALVFERQKTALRITRGGRAGGIYAEKVLAVSYAGWISPAFQLKVNYTFLVNSCEGQLLTGVALCPQYVRRAREGFVYVIHGNGLYKIGRASDPRSRLRVLGVKSPFPFRVCALISTMDMEATELELHDRFASRREYGEWFSLAYEDIEDIQKDYQTVSHGNFVLD